MGRVRTGPPTEIQPVVLQWKQTVLVSGTLLGRLIFFASENDSLRLHFFTAATTATLPESTLHLATDFRCPLLAASARDLRVAIGSDTGKTPTGRKQTTRQRKRSDQQERRRLFAGEVQGARFHTIFSNDDPSISPDSVPTTGRTIRPVRFGEPLVFVRTPLPDGLAENTPAPEKKCDWQGEFSQKAAK